MKSINRNKKIVLSILVIVLLALFIIPQFINKSVAPTQEDNQQINPVENTTIDGEVIEFEGVLNNFDSSCAFDAQCIAYVGNYKIIVNQGMVPNAPPMGMSDVNADHIGQQVKVRAIRVSDTELTIIGNRDLYVLLKK